MMISVVMESVIKVKSTISTTETEKVIIIVYIILFKLYRNHSKIKQEPTHFIYDFIRRDKSWNWFIKTLRSSSNPFK